MKITYLGSLHPATQQHENFIYFSVLHEPHDAVGEEECHKMQSRLHAVFAQVCSVLLGYQYYILAVVVFTFVSLEQQWYSVELLESIQSLLPLFAWNLRHSCNLFWYVLKYDALLQSPRCGCEGATRIYFSHVPSSLFLLLSPPWSPWTRIQFTLRKTLIIQYTHALYTCLEHCIHPTRRPHFHDVVMNSHVIFGGVHPSTTKRQ